MRIEEKLKAMGLELPPVADPAGLYVYTRRVGNLVYVSGQTPDINSVLQIKGVVGETLSLEEGKKVKLYLAGQKAGVVRYPESGSHGS